MLTKHQKINLTPIECIEHASEYAYCAEFLLRQNAQLNLSPHKVINVVYPMWSLLFQAFELLLKGYALHTMRTHKHLNTLLEYLDAFDEIKSCLHYDEVILIKKLIKKQSIRKAFQYEQESLEQVEDKLIFTDKCLQLFEKLMSTLPIELQREYLS